MAFDPSTAKPVASGGFDPGTAQPLSPAQPYNPATDPKLKLAAPGETIGGDKGEAALVQYGGAITGLARGIGQLYSKHFGTGDYARQVENQERELAKLANDPTVAGWEQKVASLSGGASDPLAILLPAGRVNTIRGLIKAGAIGGGVSGAVSAQEHDDLANRAESALTGAAGGAAFMGALGTVANGFRKLLGRELIPFTEKEAKELGDDIKQLIPHAKDEATNGAVKATQPVTPADTPDAPPNTPVGRLMAKAKQSWSNWQSTKTFTDDVEKRLHMLAASNALDTLDMHDMDAVLQKMGTTPEERKNVIHHMETMGASPLTPKEKQYYDYLEPVRKALGWTDGYFRREVMGRSKPFDNPSDQPPLSGGGALRTSSELGKARKWKMATDEDGKQHVVYAEPVKGGYKLTAWKDNKATPLGTVKSLTNEEAMARATAKTDRGIKTLEREKDILERYQGKMSSAYAKLQHVSGKLGQLKGDGEAATTIKAAHEKLKALEKEKTTLEKVPTDMAQERYKEVQEEIAGHREFLKIAESEDEKAMLRKGIKDAKAEADVLSQVRQRRDVVGNRLTRIDAQRAQLQRQLDAAGMSPEEATKLTRQIKTLESQKRVLEQVAEIYSPGERRLANISAKLDKLRADKARIESTFDPESLENKTFRDKNNREWKLGDATVRDIEQHTPTRYHDDASKILGRQYILERRIERVRAFLEETKQHMLENGLGTQGAAPDDWTTTRLRNFAGWKMPRRLANVFDQLADSQEDPAKRRIWGLSRFNDLYRHAMFAIPGWHHFNVAEIGAVTHGLVGTVRDLAAGVRVATEANNEVANIGPLYRRLYAKGYPFKYAETLSNDTYERSFNSMADDMERNPNGEEIARSMGYKSAKALADRMRQFAQRQNQKLWLYQDSVTMRRIMERMAHGETEDQAADMVFKAMPTYRMTAQNRLLNVLRKPDVTWFLPYHKDVFRAYGNMIRDVVKGTPAEKAHAADMLAMQAVIGLVVYPVLNKGVQEGLKAAHVKGGEKATVYPFGLGAPAHEVYQMATGQRGVSQEAQTVLSPAPGSKEALEQFFDRDFFTGSHITPAAKTDVMGNKKPASTPADIEARVMHALQSSLPLQELIGKGLVKALLAQEGIIIPETQAEKDAEKERRKDASEITGQ